MTSPFDRQTLEFYAAQATQYLALRPHNINPGLSEFLELLPPKARILELGCGGGADAEYMIAGGFDIVPTDGTKEMAAQAETRLGRPVKVMRFDELSADKAYDAVIASASLLHVPIAQLSAILGRIWRALKPGGWHMASYKTGGTESRDEHGRYFNYLSCDQAAVHYAAAGDWASISYDEWHGAGYFNSPAQWLKITARKIS